MCRTNQLGILRVGVAPWVLFVCLPRVLVACSSGSFVRLRLALRPSCGFRAPLRVIAGSWLLARLLGLVAATSYQ